MDQVRHRNSGRFSPLRYPGGKGKLANFVRKLVRHNLLSDGTYVEPYAGGAAVACELLLTEEVSRIEINDLSPNIYAFWFSVLNFPDELCRLVTDTKVSVAEWDKQKVILSRKDLTDPLALGFATFFLNRTNRSGILNGGIIGGRAQSGAWLIDARYNATELVDRISSIARLSGRIKLFNEDAIGFLMKGATRWNARTLVYLDPPYYVKGKGLYHHYYRHDDHVRVRDALQNIIHQRWLVSYDDVPEIRSIYAGTPYLAYHIGYSAREHTQGSEVMFFGPQLKFPGAEGPMVVFEGNC